MSNDRDIAVKFTGDTSDLDRASDKAERSVEGAGKGIGGSMAALAGPAAIAAGAIGGLATVAVGFVEAALEDDAAAAMLAQNLKTAAGASDEAVAGAESYISALSKTAAIADDDLRPALGKLAVATGSTEKAQGLLALATDISAGTGKDLATVSDALAKAQMGSTGALKKMGVATEDAAGNALTLDEVLANAQTTFKGAGEAAAGTAAGGLKKAQIGMGELQESLGSKLLPVLGAAGSFLNDTVLPALEAFGAAIGEIWNEVITELEPTLTELRTLVTGVLEGISAFWTEWGDEILGLVTGIVKLWVQYIVTEIKVIVAVITTIADVVKAFWAEWGDEITATLLAVVTFIGEAVARIAAFWAEWGDEIIGTAKAAWDIVMGIIRFALDLVTGIIRVATALFTGNWGAALAALGDIARSGLDFVLDLFNKIGGLLGSALSGVADLITKPFKLAFNAIADLWNNTIGALSFSFPDWIPGLGGNRIDVPDIPRFSTFGALTIVMPPGTDGYDVARQYTSFSRNVAPVGGLAVAVR
jgi:hypothetical protein